jgi:hypothetical protein
MAPLLLSVWYFDGQGRLLTSYVKCQVVADRCLVSSKEVWSCTQVSDWSCEACLPTACQTWPVSHWQSRCINLTSSFDFNHAFEYWICCFETECDVVKIECFLDWTLLGTYFMVFGTIEMAELDNRFPWCFRSFKEMVWEHELWVYSFQSMAVVHRK